MVWFMAETRQLLDMTELGERERRVLVLIADRLLMGQLAYGELSYRKKDWRREASEEAFDMAVYLSALLVDLDEEEPVTERNP